MTPEQAAALRAPFPKSAISKLPKGGTQLDFVGHAAVTQRLLEVDPGWNWEPVAFDETGLPLTDERGGLWIRLTIAGVTRLGYGEPQGGDPFDKVKGAIGNAIRNAAMRFGVALDLWSKDDITTTTVMPEPPKPHATGKDASRWTAAIANAATVIDLKKVADEINAHDIEAELRADLLNAWKVRHAAFTEAKSKPPLKAVPSDAS